MSQFLAGVWLPEYKSGHHQLLHQSHNPLLRQQEVQELLQGTESCNESDNRAQCCCDDLISAVSLCLSLSQSCLCCCCYPAGSLLNGTSFQYKSPDQNGLSDRTALRKDSYNWPQPHTLQRYQHIDLYYISTALVNCAYYIKCIFFGVCIIFCKHKHAFSMCCKWFQMFYKLPS